MLQYNYGFWQVWDNPMPVTFDGANKLIIVNPGVTTLDFPTDVYSNWKEWLIQTDNVNTKFAEAIRTTGGDPLPGGLLLGSSYFLQNGWRMRTWEGNHRLNVIGNVYTQEGENLFVPTHDPHNIEITLTVSALTYAIPPATAVLDDLVTLTANSTVDAISTEFGPAMANLDAPVSSRATQTSVDTVSTNVDTANTNIQTVSTAVDSIAITADSALILIEEILKYESNRTRIDKTAKTLTIYDDDDITPIRVFDLKDDTGAASIEAVFERLPR